MADATDEPILDPASVEAARGWRSLYARAVEVGAPYWRPEADGGGDGARWALAGVFALTLATTGVSVGFNFLGAWRGTAPGAAPGARGCGALAPAPRTCARS